MNITKESLLSVGASLGLSEEKLEALWKGLESKGEAHGSAPFTKYLLYLGALVTISAMTWFMGSAWLTLGGGGIFLIASAYALLFLIAGASFWKRKGMRIPSGLFITMAVCMVPLAIYGLQEHYRIFEKAAPYEAFYYWVNYRWIWMEIGTIIAGIAALWFFPFPFIMAPIVIAAWFLSMDVVTLLADEGSYRVTREWVSIGFGLLMTAIGLASDGRKKGDYAFWCYLFGALSLWGGATSFFWGRGEVVRALYAVISLLMMCFSLLIGRSVFMVFGAIGIFVYLEYLAYAFFRDSIAFPFALSCIGILIIFLGILFQKNSSKIEAAIRRVLPEGIRKYFDSLRSGTPSG